ncbi:hypothetical protein Tco_1366770, partial [Tanacetum coccineum]
AGLFKARDDEIEGLKVQLLLKEAEAAEAIRLRIEISKFEVVADLKALVVGKEHEVTDLNSLITSVKSQNDILFFILYENYMERLERFQDDLMKTVNNKFDQLYTDFVEMAVHLEEKFYPDLHTTISCCRWLLTQVMELVIVKCLNSPEYLSTLGVAISKAIEKGMQDGLSVGITHGKEVRVLADVAAHNPSVKADYVSALQKLQSANFSLLAELRSNKDASVAACCTEGTSNIVSAAANATMALSTTLAFASTVPPITIEDYEVIGTDGLEDAQKSGQGEIASFPYTVEFEKRGVGYYSGT